MNNNKKSTEESVIPKKNPKRLLLLYSLLISVLFGFPFSCAVVFVYRELSSKGIILDSCLFAIIIFLVAATASLVHRLVARSKGKWPYLLLVFVLTVIFFLIGIVITGILTMQ